MIRRISSLIIIGIFIFSSAFAVDAAELKIGYMDLAYVFDNYTKTKEQDKILEQQVKQKTDERQRLVNEVRKMKEEADVLSKDAKEKKQAAIDEKIKQLQEYDQQTKTTLGQEREKMGREILKEIETVVEKYATDNGYTMILSNRVLVYGQKQYDVTNDILNTLNPKPKK